MIYLVKLIVSACGADSVLRDKMKHREIDRRIKSYSKYYRNILINEGLKDVDQRMSSYETIATPQTFLLVYGKSRQ